MSSAASEYCDLVMKGGVTSGVVYPSAVLRLRERYRFKNIGGSSAGAIAAATTAAAELGERRKASGDASIADDAKAGFEGLDTQAARLASEGFIYSLFQPAPGAWHAYRLLLTWAGKRSLLYTLCNALLRADPISPIVFIVPLAVMVILGYTTGGGWGAVVMLLPALVLALLAASIWAFLKYASIIRGNFLGICSGLGPGKEGSAPALTEWLNEALQELSGKPDDQPLTFSDLWRAPRYEGEPKTDKAISLRMITTCVSHHEPRTLPFTEAEFWFRRDEFERLFPASVVKWMVGLPGPAWTWNGKDYYPLPHGGDMPVVVAMRMSLSFPVLLSAVPLYERWRQGGEAPVEDKKQAEKNIVESTEGVTAGGKLDHDGSAEPRLCWFSDGGISSNFPLHMFDAPLPRWPTFAINLIYTKTEDQENCKDPEKAVLSGEELLPDRHVSVERDNASKEIGSFLFAIIATMQNWRDLLQSRAPGHRERIVHVLLCEDEGGLNLNMPKEVLSSVTAKGRQAGLRLNKFDFQHHHWIRWRNLAGAMQRYEKRVAVCDTSRPKLPVHEEALRRARKGKPPPKTYKFASKKDEAEAQKLLERMIADGTAWQTNGPDLGENAPAPQPQLQIMPTF